VALRVRRKAALEEKLLAAVESLHGRGLGYGDISVETLISEAGVTRSTFYAYFEDKDALLRDLAGTVVDELLQPWLAIQPHGSKSDLRRGIDEICRTYRAHGAIMVAIDEPIPGGGAEREFTGLMARGAAAVSAYVKAGQAAGLIDPTLDAATVAALLMWMSERGLAKLVADAAPRDIDALAEGLTEIFWRTLRGEAGV
jgi:TetR/AcrR family transcriptional regulator, ethionamide resistance regulator